MTTKAGAASVAKKQVVSIPELEIQEITVDIVSRSPLIVNYPKDIAKRLLSYQTVRVKKKEARNPQKEYLNTLYYFKNEKKTGFPAHGFKAALVRAAKSMNMNMTDVRGQVYVIPDEVSSGLVEIQGKHEIRSDRVVIGKGSSDIRFRAMYLDWKATLNIEFNSGVLTLEHVLTMVRIAGFSCGIGEWRPEKSNSGYSGRWSIAV